MTSDTLTDSEPLTGTVLIVEDEQPLADLYAAWLTETYSIRTAYDGEQALDQLDEQVAVVLLDRRMPQLSGDDVLERIRERNYDCHVAMVSGVHPDFDIIEMGFDDYLTTASHTADRYRAGACSNQPALAQDQAGLSQSRSVV